MTPQLQNQAEEPQAAMTPPSPRRPSFFQGVTFTGAGTALNIVFLFLETMVAVRVLDTETFGVYALLVVVVNFLVMLTDVGSTTSVTQLIASSQPSRQAALVSSTIVFRFAVLAVVSLFIVSFGRTATFLLDPSMVLLDYSIFIPMMLMTVSLDESLQAILQGYHAFHHMAIANGLRTVLRLGLSVVFLLVLHLGIEGLIYSWIISFGIAVVYEYIVLPPQARRFSLNRQILGETLRFGLPLQLNRFLWFVSARADVLLLGMLIGPSAVALFEVGGRIPNALVRLTQSYSAVYFPTMTELLSQGENDRAHLLLNRSLRVLSFSMALSALVAVVFGQQIVTMLFSAKYEASSAVFSLLMIGLQMNILVTLMGYTMVSAGSPGHSLAANAVRETLIVVSDLILIPLWGVLGPALGKLGAYYLANPLSVWMLRRSQIRVVMAPYLKQTALLWLCAILFWWLRPQGFLLQMTMIVIFLALNFALGTVSRADVELVLPRALTKRLPRRKEVAPHAQ